MSTNGNVIWRFFNKSESDGSKAQCNECEKILSLGSSKPKLQMTHGLKNHLQKCHADSYSVYQKRASEVSAEESARKKMKVENSPSNPIPTSSHHCQPTLSQFNARRTKFSDDIVQRIDKSIIDLLIVDMLPFSTIVFDHQTVSVSATATAISQSSVSAVFSAMAVTEYSLSANFRLRLKPGKVVSVGL